MPDDDEGRRRWIVEPPPAPSEVSLYMECGEGVVLTEEQENALSALLSSLERRDAEVVGHDVTCSDHNFVCTLTCTKVVCDRLICELNKAAASIRAGSWSLIGSFNTPLV